jgi:hypothetical protein
MADRVGAGKTLDRRRPRMARAARSQTRSGAGVAEADGDVDEDPVGLAPALVQVFERPVQGDDPAAALGQRHGDPPVAAAIHADVLHIRTSSSGGSSRI